MKSAEEKTAVSPGNREADEQTIASHRQYMLSLQEQLTSYAEPWSRSNPRGYCQLLSHKNRCDVSAPKVIERHDYTSWCLANQALGHRELVGGGKRELILSLFAFPSRSMAITAWIGAAQCSAKYNMKIHQDNVAFLPAIHKPLELRKSYTDV